MRMRRTSVGKEVFAYVDVGVCSETMGEKVRKIQFHPLLK